jgi:hypothetical protein
MSTGTEQELRAARRVGWWLTGTSLCWFAVLALVVLTTDDIGLTFAASFVVATGAFALLVLALGVFLIRVGRMRPDIPTASRVPEEASARRAGSP